MALTGTQSPLLVQHLTRLIAGAMPDARVIPVSEAGHMLPFTHAAAIAHVLAHHFAEAERHALSARTPPDIKTPHGDSS